MSIAHLERALRIVAENPEQADFVGPRDPDLIARAENALSVAFPPTYKRFLRELGAGYFGAECFYGITSDNFANSSAPNGIWATLQDRQTFGLPIHLIHIHPVGEGTHFFLDTDQKNADDECPVVAWIPGLTEPGDDLEVIAAEFGEFFRSTVEEALVLIREASPGAG